jgi:hypothetical protein
MAACGWFIRSAGAHRLAMQRDDNDTEQLLAQRGW